MTGIASISIRRNHERRQESSHVENLTRDAHLLLDTAGVTRGTSWVSRTVRDYLAAPIEGMPFGLFLAAKVELNHHQRRRLAERADLRYLMTYADPTGETAVRNVMREQARRG